MKFLKIISKALTCLLIAFTFAIMSLAIYNFVSIKILHKDYPNLFGYTFFEIISGSMSPTIEKGDMILVELGEDYDVGDIITYASADSKLITHRIIDKESIGTETSTYITKGDNNLVEDPSSVSTSAIYGKVLFRIPRIGYIQDFFAKPSNYFICILIPAILFVIYEVIRIFVLLKQKKAY